MKLKTVKKLFVFAALGFFLSIFVGIHPVYAASVNTEKVTLYYLEDVYKQYISKPSSFAESYQIQVSGAQGKPTYKIKSGESAQVSSTGLVTMATETWYCKGGYCSTSPSDGSTKRVEYVSGESTVEVSVDGQKFEIKINVMNYAQYNAEQVMDNYLKENITSSMTQKQKMEKIASLVASRSYSSRFSGYVGLFSAEGGDCWASVSAILYMADKVGIEAHSRDGRQDAGAGSGHMNVAAILDGKVYVVEAGYDGEAPRLYTIIEAQNGFSSDNFYTWVHYDGYDKEASVPEHSSVTILGQLAFLFGKHDKTQIVTVHVPKTITKIEIGAFTGVPTLTTVDISSDNANYKSVNGIVYTKDGSTIIAYPSGKPESNFTVPTDVKNLYGYVFAYNKNLVSVTLPQGLTTIAEEAFYEDENLKNVSIPSSVTKIETFAFGETGIEKITVGKNVTEIGDYAFYRSSLKYILLENKDVKIGTEAIDNKVVICGYKGSTAETYAKEHNNQFVAIDDYDEVKFITTDMVSGISDYEYTGSEIKLPLVIQDGTYKLKENTDYTVTYKNNVNPGNATLTISGKGKYIGNLSYTFKVTPKRIIYQITKTKASYNGGSQAPTFEFDDEGNYTIMYQQPDNPSWWTNSPSWVVEVGTYELKYQISRTGYKTEEGTVTFTITPGDINEATILYLNESYIYTGSKIEPYISVKIGNRYLQKGSDYTIEYSNNINPGTATLKLIGLGHFQGTSKTVTFKIEKDKIDVADVYISGKDTYDYTGVPIQPSIYVVYGYRWLVEGKDYRIEYKNNVNPGTATITVVGIGNYSGSKSISFTIRPIVTEDNLVYYGLDYKGVFNFQYYINKYPDVKKAYGDNVSGAFLHFLNYGMKEGRQASDEFNVMYYKANYEVLADEYQDNLPSYYYHYIQFGKASGTNGKTLQFSYYRKNQDFSKIFNLDYYMKINKDVANAYYNPIYGYDYVKIFNHFYDAGIHEGRSSIEGFNVMYYKANNEDLANSFQDDIAAYYYHYQNYGANEKRNAQTLNFSYHRKGRDFGKIFDLQYYMEQNPDVAKAYHDPTHGYDYVKIFEHFYNYGIHEGRKSINNFQVMFYKANYKDLYNAYKDDTAAYYYHYQDYGSTENRNAQTLAFQYQRYGYDFSRIFDLDYYCDHNKDVVKAYTDPHYGVDYVKIFEHFYNYGMKEGRQSSPNFDVEYYRSHNKDVAKAFPNDLASCYMHYMINGYDEGRQATTQN